MVRSSGSMIGAHQVGAHHDDPLMHSRRHDLRAGRERVEEPRTGCREVESPGLAKPDLILYETSGGGEHHVGGHRGDDEGADVAVSESPGPP